jgi:hypothetical protein
MQAFAQHLYTRRDIATTAAKEACDRLIGQLVSNCTELGPSLAEAAHLQAYARWWQATTDAIERDGIDPITALHRSRDTARRILLDHLTPRSDCPFTYGEAVAAHEAARAFYHDTGELDVAPPTPDNPSAGSAIPPITGRPIVVPRRPM